MKKPLADQTNIINIPKKNYQQQKCVQIQIYSPELSSKLNVPSPRQTNYQLFQKNSESKNIEQDNKNGKQQLIAKNDLKRSKKEVIDFFTQQIDVQYPQLSKEEFVQILKQQLKSNKIQVKKSENEPEVKNNQNKDILLIENQDLSNQNGNYNSMMNQNSQNTIPSMHLKENPLIKDRKNSQIQQQIQSQEDNNNLQQQQQQLVLQISQYQDQNTNKIFDDIYDGNQEQKNDDLEYQNNNNMLSSDNMDTTLNNQELIKSLLCGSNFQDQNQTDILLNYSENVYSQKQFGNIQNSTNLIQSFEMQQIESQVLNSPRESNTQINDTNMLNSNENFFSNDQKMQELQNKIGQQDTQIEKLTEYVQIQHKNCLGLDFSMKEMKIKNENLLKQKKDLLIKIEEINDLEQKNAKMLLQQQLQISQQQEQIKKQENIISIKQNSLDQIIKEANSYENQLTCLRQTYLSEKNQWMQIDQELQNLKQLQILQKDDIQKNEKMHHDRELESQKKIFLNKIKELARNHENQITQLNQRISQMTAGIDQYQQQQFIQQSNQQQQQTFNNDNHNHIKQQQQQQQLQINNPNSSVQQNLKINPLSPGPFKVIKMN